MSKLSINDFKSWLRLEKIRLFNKWMELTDSDYRLSSDLPDPMVDEEIDTAVSDFDVVDDNDLGVCSLVMELQSLRRSAERGNWQLLSAYSECDPVDEPYVLAKGDIVRKLDDDYNDLFCGTDYVQFNELDDVDDPVINARAQTNYEVSDLVMLAKNSMVKMKSGADIHRLFDDVKNMDMIIYPDIKRPVVTLFNNEYGWSDSILEHPTLGDTEGLVKLYQRASNEAESHVD